MCAFLICTFEGNGDEGIHFGGPFNNGAMNPNRVTHSVAVNNVGEGFYLLNANNVEAYPEYGVREYRKDCT